MVPYLKTIMVKNVTLVGFEPSSNVAKYSREYLDKLYLEFFNANSFKKDFGLKKAKIITAISMFYDLEDPNQFISDIKELLDPEGIFIIQQNYLVGMLQQCAYDNIVHEHLEYYSLLSLENLLKRHDLEVFDVEERDLNGGSFRTYICHKGKRPISSAVNKMRATEADLQLDNSKIYKEFTKRVLGNTDKLYNFIISQVRMGKKIYVYGASTRGNTLLQAAYLDNKQISAAVERNPDKWGLIMSGTEIPIISEELARFQKPDYMLVLPWFFKKEFIERETEYLKSGGHLIFPLPTFEVI